jgi:hypothetical protein
LSVIVKTFSSISGIASKDAASGGSDVLGCGMK